MTWGFDIPQVDLFEASVPTAPVDVRPGDRIAASWTDAHAVVAVHPRPTGAYIDLRNSSGAVYTIFRRSDLPVVGSQ